MKLSSLLAVVISSAALLAFAGLGGCQPSDQPPGQNLSEDGATPMNDARRPAPPRTGDDGPSNDRRPPRPESSPPKSEIDLTQHAKGSVIFQGGHETDRQDGGRPVVLIAAALGVKTEVFRDAFSGVTPARGRGPTDAEARRNKQILMDALGKYGVTNARLDEVSNYYRYRPQDGELWPHQTAKATAIIENGEVTGLKLTSAGAGYSSPPQVIVAGYPDAKFTAEIEFGKDLKTNGKVSSLSLEK